MGCLSNNNFENPNAPEYQKGHKPENNNGCGGSCSGSLDTSNTTKSLTTKIVKKKLTRKDFQ